MIGDHEVIGKGVGSAFVTQISDRKQGNDTSVVDQAPLRFDIDNKAVYTAAPVAGGWAGAVMSWAGAVMRWAGAIMSWAGAIKAIRILKVKA